MRCLLPIIVRQGEALDLGASVPLWLLLALLGGLLEGS